MPNCFQAADILLPQKVSMKKWACVACDQFSSQREYWDAVTEFVGDAPSTLHMIIPEAYLGGDTPARTAESHRTMERYLQEGLFRTCRRSFVYLERTLQNGKKRRGLVGQVDLEDYDFHPGSGALIRATEATVEDRLPPRMRLLRDAALEFPHVLLLCNDERDAILQAAEAVLGEKLYDFDLQQDGGHITGHLISGLGVGVVNGAVSDYIAASTEHQGADPMAFAVGDGNHSLAAAKACWEEIKPSLSEEEKLTHPARYALVELENIHDPAIDFEAIHRVVQGVHPEALRDFLRENSDPEGFPVTVTWQGGEEILRFSRAKNPLAIGILQPLLDDFLAENGGEMDYIHGAEVVRQLSDAPGALGLILPAMEKKDLFPGVLKDGVLPRKTFSMGVAREKRYYLEGKKRR